MADVTVLPSEFELVDFDAAEIAAVTADLCDRLGIAAATRVTVDIDETEMVGRVLDVAAEGTSITVKLTGGALESQRQPRQFSPEKARTVLGMVLLRAVDRLGPMKDAPADADLDVKQWTAWEASAEGRLDRAGIPTRKTKRLYSFRLRHGFSDDIDGVFEQLWAADDLTWAGIEAICAETAALDPGPLPTIKA